MANPTTLVSNFDGDFAAETQAGATTWTNSGASFWSPGVRDLRIRPSRTVEPVDGYSIFAFATVLANRQYLWLQDSDTVAIDPDNILSSLSGSIAFKFRRMKDTGSLEPMLEVGENNAGYDHLQIFIDADTLWVAWDSEGALPQTIDHGLALTVGQEYFVYTYWDELTFGVSIDNGTPVVATRDVPTGNLGTNLLTLEAA